MRSLSSVNKSSRLCISCVSASKVAFSSCISLLREATFRRVLCSLCWDSRWSHVSNILGLACSGRIHIAFHKFCVIEVACICFRRDWHLWQPRKKANIDFSIEGSGQHLAGTYFCLIDTSVSWASILFCSEAHFASTGNSAAWKRRRTPSWAGWSSTVHLVSIVF